MTESKRREIADTIKVLTQLDRNSLFLIDSGARLLVAKQTMDKEEPEGSDYIADGDKEILKKISEGFKYLSDFDKGYFLGVVEARAALKRDTDKEASS